MEENKILRRGGKHHGPLPPRDNPSLLFLPWNARPTIHFTHTTHPRCSDQPAPSSPAVTPFPWLWETSAPHVSLPRPQAQWSRVCTIRNPPLTLALELNPGPSSHHHSPLFTVPIFYQRKCPFPVDTGVQPQVTAPRGALLRMQRREVWASAFSSLS